VRAGYQPCASTVHEGWNRIDAWPGHGNLQPGEITLYFEPFATPAERAVIIAREGLDASGHLRYRVLCGRDPREVVRALAGDFLVGYVALAPPEAPEEIESFLSRRVEPDAWQALARFDGDEWLLYLRDAPLEAMNTLRSVEQGLDYWLFVAKQAKLSP
jgi:hypothetical protein